MKRIKKLLALILALSLLMGMLAVPGWAEPAAVTVPDKAVVSDSITSSGTVIASGYCGGEGDGTNLTWMLTEDGILTISGEGAMKDWGVSSIFPWYSYLGSVKTVVVGDAVTTIGNDAFSDCKALTTVTIGNSVTTIGDSAFYRCESLATVTIGDSVTTIGDNAFSYCKALTTVTIGDSVATIGDYAFAYCDSRPEIYFKGDAPTFGTKVFQSVSATVYYPAWNKTWTEAARQDYGGNITWLSLDDEGSPAGYCGGEGDGTNLTWKLTEDGVLTISGEGAMADWEYAAAPWFDYYDCIEAAVIEDDVITIGENAFSGQDSLSAVSIGDSVETIGDYAFRDCDSLTTVDIPDSVTTIGERAFYNCSSLTTVTIGSAVTTIGNYVFYYTSLTEIHFKGDAPKFGSNVFKNVTATAYYPAGNDTWTQTVRLNYGGKITWVAYEPAVIASGYCGGEGDGTNLTWKLTEDGALTISGVGAMADWNSLLLVPWYSFRKDIKSVVIGDSVETIGDNAFHNAAFLSSVTIGDSVSIIGSSAFHNCLFIPSVTIPDSVTTIRDYAFCGCQSLTSLTISAFVTTIGSCAFCGCTSLTAIFVDENNPNYSGDSFGVLFNQNKTTLIQAPGALRDAYTIPSSVTTIGEAAFSYCQNLTTVDIPASVSIIEDGAFGDCSSLTSMIIPASVIIIEDDVFADCSNLAEIRFEGDAPIFDGDFMFRRVTTTAYYPAGNDTWTEDVLQDYGGTITWVPVDVMISCDSCTSTETAVTVQYDADAAETVVCLIVIYDKEGRFMRTETVEGQITSDGSIQLSITYTEEEAAQIGRIAAYVVDGDTWIPLCDDWSKTVNF